MRTPARLLPALGLTAALLAGCTSADGPRPAGDPVTAEEADLLAGVLSRNFAAGGADFVVTAPYDDESVLTLSGAVDFRTGTGRGAAVTRVGPERAEQERPVWFTHEALWLGDVDGLGTEVTHLRRPLLPAGDPAPPLLDVLARLVLNLAASAPDDAAAFLDEATWQGRRSVDGRLTALYGLPDDVLVAVSATDDVLVQFAAPVPADGDEAVEVTVTLAEHGRRSLDLPADQATAEAADHPELGAALGV